MSEPAGPAGPAAAGGRRRYTVSLVVAGRVGAEIDGMRRALGARSLLRIPPHVTLVPPVNVAAAEEAAVLEVVRSAAETASPITVDLGGPATFLPRNPVLYLAVAGDLDAVVELRRRLAAGPLASPAGREELPFVPHVTLDQRIDPARVPAALAALADYRQPYTFEEVTLLEQDATPDRAWQPVAAYRLAAPAVVGRGGVEIVLAAAPALDPADTRWTAGALGDAAGMPFAVTARRGGLLAGAAAGCVRAGVCELRSVVVDPACRRQGIGSQLVRAVEDLAAGAGCSAVRVTVDVGGAAAALFAARGYLMLVGIAPPPGTGGALRLVLQRLLPPRAAGAVAP